MTFNTVYTMDLDDIFEELSKEPLDVVLSKTTFFDDIEEIQHGMKNEVELEFEVEDVPALVGFHPHKSVSDTVLEYVYRDREDLRLHDKVDQFKVIAESSFAELPGDLQDLLVGTHADINQTRDKIAEFIDTYVITPLEYDVVSKVITGADFSSEDILFLIGSRLVKTLGKQSQDEKFKDVVQKLIKNIELTSEDVKTTREFLKARQIADSPDILKHTYIDLASQYYSHRQIDLFIKSYNTYTGNDVNKVHSTRTLHVVGNISTPGFSVVGRIHGTIINKNAEAVMLEFRSRSQFFTVTPNYDLIRTLYKMQMIGCKTAEFIQCKKTYGKPELKIKKIIYENHEELWNVVNARLLTISKMIAHLRVNSDSRRHFAMADPILKKQILKTHCKWT